MDRERRGATPRRVGTQRCKSIKLFRRREDKDMKRFCIMVSQATETAPARRPVIGL